MNPDFDHRHEIPNNESTQSQPRGRNRFLYTAKTLAEIVVIDLIVFGVAESISTFIFHQPMDPGVAVPCSAAIGAGAYFTKDLVSNA